MFVAIFAEMCIAQPSSLFPKIGGEMNPLEGGWKKSGGKFMPVLTK